MKALAITSIQFQLTLKSYKEWLETLNYSESAVKSYPVTVRELLHYLEQKNITELQQITPELINKYIEHIKIRKNQSTEGALATNTINGMINGVTKFIQYLRLTKNHHIHIEPKRLKNQSTTKTILTKKEINELFESIDNPMNPIAQRNQAILTVLYAGGLRRNEIIHLELTDVSFENSTLHIRKGKGGKERLVPLTKKYMNYIKAYIQNCRDIFCDITPKSSTALFIHIDGTALTSDQLENLVKQLIKHSNIESLQEKTITLHTFRHSIATHLLQAGMDIESIAKFLGHSSLDSTMIYTHILEEQKYEGL